MPNKALAKIIEDGSLFPEDISLLSQIITRIEIRLAEVKKGLPPELGNLVTTEVIPPDPGKENEHDEFIINVNFYSSSGAIDSFLSLQGSFSFCVRCLDPSIEDIVEKRFFDDIFNYVRTSRQFLVEKVSSFERVGKMMYVSQ